MTAAQFETLGPSDADELLRARFEALAEWNIPLDEARAIAACVEVDIVEAVRLLEIGCPAEIVLPLLV
ncbi:MAG: hypothetical protein ACXWZP_09855 [Gaiellaceae bacterium]